MASRRRGVGRAAWILAALALQAPATRAVAAPPQTRSESDKLFYDANALMAEGKIAEACRKYEQSLSLLRRGGTLLNLAICREAVGEPAAALPLFLEALEVAVRDGRADRAVIARQHIDALRPKPSWIAITVPPGADLPDLSITFDGAVLPREKWGLEVAAIPGLHVVVATAPGRDRFEASITLGETGDRQRVQIPLLQQLRAAAPAAPEAAAPRAPAPPPRADHGLAHRWQLGAVARVDIDPIHPGARAVAGLTFGIGDSLEVGASALMGRESGIEPQLTVFFLERTAWKPLLNAGVPIFFANGANAGVRGSAGVQWDINRHFGVFAQVGGAYFAGAGPGYARGVFLPSLGAQGRI